MSHAFSAKFPGRCLCGASFKAGARIYWDSSVRRATGCPACAPAKARPGKSITVDGAYSVRFDTHPTTGAVVLCAITGKAECGGAAEVYYLRDGRWTFGSIVREPIFTGSLSHETIEGWRAMAGA